MQGDRDPIQADYLQAKREFDSQFTRQMLTYDQVLDSSRAYYVRAFPLQTQLWATYLPIILLVGRDQPRVVALFIALSTFFQLISNRRSGILTRERGSLSQNDYRQYIVASRLFTFKKTLACRQIVTSHPNSIVEFERFLTDTYHVELKEVRGIQRMPLYQILYRGTLKARKLTGYVRQLRTYQDFSIQLRPIVHSIFEQGDLIHARETKEHYVERLAELESLNQEEQVQIDRFLRFNRKIVSPILITISGLIYAARDFLVSTFIVECNRQIILLNLKGVRISILGSFILTTQTYIWRNLDNLFLLRASSAQLIRLSQVLFFEMLKKLRLHMNYYSQLEQFDSVEIKLVSIHLNLSTRTQPNPERAFSLFRGEVANPLKQLIVRSGNQSHARKDLRNTYTVMGKYYIYFTPKELSVKRESCFNLCVKRVLAYLLSQPNLEKEAQEFKSLMSALIALRDPFLLAQAAGFPLIGGLTEVRKKGPHLMMSCGHIRLQHCDKIHNKFNFAPDRIWKTQMLIKIPQDSLKQQKRRSELRIECQTEDLQDFGCMVALNSFNRKHLHGVGCMDIQTLVDLSGKKMTASNVCYLACLLYRDDTVYQQQSFDTVNYKDRYADSKCVEQSVVRRMLQIASNYYEETNEQFYWYTFSGLKFDYFLLWQWLLKSNLEISSFGLHHESKGYYVRECKFYDLRTIFAAGTLAKLTQHLHYAKKQVDITNVTTIQEFLERRVQLSEYCMYDCLSLMNLFVNYYTSFMEILIRMHTKYQPTFSYCADFIQFPRKILASFTASGQSMYMIKKTILPQGLTRLAPPQYSAWERSRVFGGMVQVYRHYNPRNELIVELDVKAMYSGIMLEDLNYQLMSFRQYTGESLYEKEGQIMVLYLKDIRLSRNTRYPTLPVRTGVKGIIYPRQIQSHILSLKQYNHINDRAGFQFVRISGVMIFSTSIKGAEIGKPIRACVSELMRMRQQFEARKREINEPLGGYNHLMSDFVKLLSNSISGKFLMKFFPTVTISTHDFQRQEDDEEHQVLLDPLGRTVLDYSEKDRAYIGDLVHMGRYITSQGRFQILRAINQLERGEFEPYYGDTDSVWTTQKGAQYLAARGLTSGTIGQLENKGDYFNQCVFINRKTYILFKALPKQFDIFTLLEWHQKDMEFEMTFVENTFGYTFSHSQRQNFKRRSPITQYLIEKKFLKVGFKGFCRLPSWTELAFIQISTVLTIQSVATLPGNKQRGHPILNSQFLQLVLDLKGVRINQFHDTIEKISQADIEKFLRASNDLNKTSIKLTCQQENSAVYRATKDFVSVSFVDNKKVLMFNPKRQVLKGGKTAPFDNLESFEE